MAAISTSTMRPAVSKDSGIYKEEQVRLLYDSERARTVKSALQVADGSSPLIVEPFASCYGLLTK